MTSKNRLMRQCHKCVALNGELYLELINLGEIAGEILGENGKVLACISIGHEIEFHIKSCGHDDVLRIEDILLAARLRSKD